MLGCCAGEQPHVSQYMFLSNLITSKLATLLHHFAVWPSRRLPPLLQNKSLFSLQLSSMCPPVPACSHPSPSSFQNFSNMLIYKRNRRGIEHLLSIYTFHKDVLPVNGVHSNIIQTSLLFQLLLRQRGIYLLFHTLKMLSQWNQSSISLRISAWELLIESKP